MTRYVRVSLEAQSASAEMSPKVASSQSRLQRTCLRGVRCYVCVSRDPRDVGITRLLLARNSGRLDRRAQCRADCCSRSSSRRSGSRGFALGSANEQKRRPGAAEFSLT